ncbi:MAG: NMD3-related protein [Candidatus Diapherotrites archaeon]|nr:NMD3-related protein [Candidatus Diapherotrites archaeon]
MSFEKFCPNCGKETEWLVKGKCADCFLKSNSIFSVKNVSDKILHCGRCSKVLLQGKWIARSEKAVANEIESRIKLIPDLQGAKIFVEAEKIGRQNGKEDFSVKVKVIGIIDSQVIEQEKGYIIELQGNICDPCMRLASDYREAIIQLRTNSKKDAETMLHETEELIKEENSKDPLSAIVKTIKVRNGFDLWIGSKKSAVKVSRKLAKLYDTRPTVSNKLIGQNKDGSDKYRFTFCVKKL